MALKIIRGMFILACAFMGLIWTNYILDNIVAKDLTVPMTGGTQTLWYAFGGGAGAFIAIALLLALKLVTQELFERLFPVFVAIVFSMIIGFGLAQYIRLFWPIENEDDVLRHVYTTTTLVLLFGFVGIFLGLTKASNWESLISVVKKRQVQFGNPKIVDTSVIIDGRILEIVEAGFIEGSLVIPRFVLNELQHIADSADLLRRTKGRRGLDILKSMQEGSSGIVVEIIDDDPTDAREVDAKIVALAREYKAKVLTTDYNLNKVAQIEGIDVLNINDLANALKPAALPDEHIEVKIVKEGKEADQGVGYLDDGTMIVVDGGRKYVGQKASVVVTSVLQTAAGRMIFTKINQVLTNEPPQAEAS